MHQALEFLYENVENFFITKYVERQLANCKRINFRGNPFRVIPIDVRVFMHQLPIYQREKKEDVIIYNGKEDIFCQITHEGFMNDYRMTAELTEQEKTTIRRGAAVLSLPYIA